MYNSEKIKVGILGCANIAIRYLGPAFQAHPGFNLIGFAGRNFENTTSVARQFNCQAFQSYQSMIDCEDIDLVYIPLPNSLHFEWVIKSLTSGKHVICEKSLGCNYSEVEEMISVARKCNKLLFENFQFRFHSQHDLVKKILFEGEIGAIRCFRSSFGFPPFKSTNNIRYKSDLGGGSLLDAGAYTIKATQFILGDNFKVKAATLNISKDFGVDLFGGIYMQNESGQFAELSFGFDNHYQCNYEIWGSLGKITATRAFTAPPGFKPSLILEKDGKLETIVLSEDNHFENMLYYVFQLILNGEFEGENKTNLNQSLNIQRVLEIADRFIV